MLSILLSGCSQGLIWGLLALGFYVAFRLLDFADMTCEGAITLGAAVMATCLYKGVNAFLALPIAFLFGCLAGIVTGLLHTKLKIPPILSGILTMTALYSLNIHIMSFANGTDSTANLSLLNYSTDTVYALIAKILPIGKTYATLLFGLLIGLAMIALLYLFFGTEIGCAIRATGTNEKMCRAQGINTDMTKIIGLALANGLIALSGALLSQQQGYADVKMGIGSIVIGLASIIIGEAICGRSKSFFIRLVGILAGSVIYRVIVALVIYSGMPTDDTKLMTAAVVVVALAITNFPSLFRLPSRKKATNNEGGEEKDA